MKFYYVEKNYINYLKQFDNQIPNISYTSNDKFVCGAVLNVNNKHYYAPISHFNKRQRTNFAIYDNDCIISTVRLCFMFPVPSNVDVLAPIVFQNLDSKYSSLIKKEYLYCKQHYSELLDKAQKVYNIGTNKNHRFNYTCCDFVKLEEICNKYDPRVKY